MLVVEVRLNGFTGETLQNFLVNQVDSNNWIEEIKYEFYLSQNNHRRKKPSFTILPKPTENQPGNGLVKFLNLHKDDYKGYRHKDLEDVYHNRDFPQSREKYLQNDLKDEEEDRILAANVLLSFEIARRVDEEEETYLLTRSEVKKAIENVMSLEERNYDKKIKLLQELFAAKLDEDTEKHYFLRCKNRVAAFRKLTKVLPKRYQDLAASSELALSLSRDMDEMSLSPRIQD